VAGEVIGFGRPRSRRQLSPSTSLARDAGVSKGRELYGLFEARQALRDKGYALVVEGYMDVVALAQAGYANAVATLGTACTADMCRSCFRYTDTGCSASTATLPAAAPRARARAALPHAGDLRTVRFLFPAPEHGPRQLLCANSALGLRGTGDCRRAAVRVSSSNRRRRRRPGTAEGRSRMLAQRRPLWHALPEVTQAPVAAGTGTPRATRAARSRCAVGARRRRAAAAPVAGHGAGPHRAAPAGRRAPENSADLALRLLLRHSDWWQACPPTTTNCCTRWAAATAP